MTTPTITPTRNGPYLVEGLERLRNSRGEALEARPKMYLCRCRGSQNQPFCDGTHWYKQFSDPRN